MDDNPVRPHVDIFDDHPSLEVSLEDFEHNDTRSPILDLPSQHSGFKSEESEGETDSNSEGVWSPPAWRRNAGGSTWYRHQPYQQDSRNMCHSTSPSKLKPTSGETSPLYESAKEEDEDITIPANVPLPRGSMSPVKERPPSPSPYVQAAQESGHKLGKPEEAGIMPDSANNYIRFAMRAEVQHRAEPVEAAISNLRAYYSYVTKTRARATTIISFIVVAILSLHSLFQPPVGPPVPDLIKVAGLARSFEPLIFYSENGVQQIGELQETGVAVWDLGESMRSANMTSAPLIVRSLDDLSESLKVLAIELTKFFANVDGDIDGILIVMDWAKRELSALSSKPLTSLSSAFTNIHNLLSRLGFLESPSTGLPTPAGKLLTELFGTTRSQRTRHALQRTFNEFLGILEESISSELAYSGALISLFENVDRQFLNLQRSVIREFDAQEREEEEVLGSLWTRILGPSASTLRKYEKNRHLLASIRTRTVQNKGLLVEHNGKLVSLKINLETLRRKLVSPLVRREDGCSITVEEQIQGLDGTYEYLRKVREKQKGRLMEALYGSRSKHIRLGAERAAGIESG